LLSFLEICHNKNYNLLTLCRTTQEKMIHGENINDLQLEDVEDYVADYPSSGNYAQQGPNLHSVGDSSASSKGYRRNKAMALVRANKWFLAVVGTVLLVMVVIIGMVSGASKATSEYSNAEAESVNGVADQAPIIVDPDSLDPSITGPLLTALLETYDRHGLDTSVLDDASGNTPQRQAFFWLATHENLDSLEHTEKVQRFALATLYYATNKVPHMYATNPDPWTNAHLWLSLAHACEWKGIICNSEQHVEAIDMERNNLSGALPQELALMYEHLSTLDMTSNLIYMDGDAFNIFEPLINLETILMDDNFLVTDDGLPWQFRKLTKLSKLRLSYNLMAGELESTHVVLGNLKHLTHLEVESNFLTGTIPEAIAQMSNLLYLYLRRNEMSFNLDFLKEGKLTNLCTYPGILWTMNAFFVPAARSELTLFSLFRSSSPSNPPTPLKQLLSGWITTK
jgi:hypothetical protein